MNTSAHTPAQHFSPPQRIAMVTETYPPEVYGVATNVDRMVGGIRKWQQQRPVSYI